MKAGDGLRKILSLLGRWDGLDDLLSMSEHHNGYTRENAVRRLGMLGSPLAIPHLIARANDWVPQVRNAAVESLQNLLKDENAEAFVLCLPQLHHLKKCGREDHSPLVSSITSFLLSPNNSAYLKSAAESDDARLARIAVRLCAENALMDRYDLASKSLCHKDLVVRSIGSELLRYFSGEQLEALLQKAIQDPFMPIRREAFQIYLRALPERGLSIASGFLFDRNAAIRHIAMRYLRKNGVDVQARFADVLSASEQNALKLRCAILGLAEIGARDAIPTIQAFADYRLASVRRACLQAVTKMLGEQAKDYLLNGLKDESQGVAKESARLVTRLRLQFSSDELLGVIGETRYGHTLKVGISCARRINKWERLILLMKLVGRLASNSESTRMLEKELEKWDRDFNRSSSQPASHQIDRLRDNYSQCRKWLSQRRARALQFTMKGCGLNV